MDVILHALCSGSHTSPSDGLLRPCPLSCQQGPLKLRILWNQKKLGALKPALFEALLQALQLLRAVLLKDHLSPKERSIHTMLPCPKEILEVEDQHLWLGWALLRWCFDKANVALTEVLGVYCVDPILTKKN